MPKLRALVHAASHPRHLLLTPSRKEGQMESDLFKRFCFTKQRGLASSAVKAEPRARANTADLTGLQKVPSFSQAEDASPHCSSASILEAPLLSHLKPDLEPASQLQTPSPSGNTPRGQGKKRKAADRKPEVFSEDSPGVPELLGDKPLRLIIVGTNPSGHAWRSGHYYSNPNNNMWKILKQTGIAPDFIRGAQDDHRMPDEVGVGFLDVGCGVPGTLLSDFSSDTMQAWVPAFYQRLKDHMRRACESIGCTCGTCGAPAFVGFAGKRQLMELLNRGKRGKCKTTRIDLGLQTVTPEGWPFPQQTQVWVLPSTSGAAPMTVEERVGPYRELARELQLSQAGWPRIAHCCCHKSTIRFHPSD